MVFLENNVKQLTIEEGFSKANYDFLFSYINFFILRTSVKHMIMDNKYKRINKYI